MDSGRNILNILSSAVYEYLSQRTDDLRKNIVSRLSVGFSRVLAILVIMMLLLIVLGVFAYAFVVLIGEAIGSVGGAALIVGGVYLVVVAVLFLLRKRLFLNMFTSLFSGIIGDGTPSDSLRSLLLVIVQNLRSSMTE